MLRTVFCMLLCFACVGHVRAQQVIVAHDESPATVPPAAKKPAVVLQPFIAQPQTSAKQEVAKTQPVKQPIVRAQPIGPKPAAADKAKPQPNVVMNPGAPSATPGPQASPAKTQLTAAALTSAPAKLVKPA